MIRDTAARLCAEQARTARVERSGARYALCTMCIGVGQGIALILESV